MRDILVTLLVFGSLPYILSRPWIGVMVWSWLSYMNPHRLTWGFAFNMPFAQIVAITLLAAIVFSREKFRFPWSGTVKVWLCYIFWMGISTAFAVYPKSAMGEFTRILKIQLVTFLTLLLLDNYKKIHTLVWVIALSIGFFSIKGGVFTILNGGAYRVYGPYGSFIEENNSLALATLMVIPLFVYLYSTAQNKWLKYALLFSAIASAASVLGSQSRGAYIGIIAVSGFFWWRSKAKIITGGLIMILAVVGFMFMPQSWHDRMNTIQNYQEDGSAMGRINAWQYSINIANDRLTGGGLISWKPGTFAIYAPNPTDVHAAHSIFFGPLGDHGWPGLFLFCLILFLAWRNLSRVIKWTQGKAEYSQQNFLARMLQVSMVAYMSAGAFLSLAYFDLPWHIIALSVLLKDQLASLNQENKALPAARYQAMK